MANPHPDLLVIFKEIQRENKPILNLKNPQDYDLFIRVLRLVNYYHIKLDVEQVSKILVDTNLFGRLKANMIMNENERLLHDYFLDRDYRDGFAVSD